MRTHARKDVQLRAKTRTGGLTAPEDSRGVSILNKTCLSQPSDQQGAGLSTGPLCLIDTLLPGLFRTKELSYRCCSTLDQCYEQCRQTAAKHTGPCLESPPPHWLPQAQIVPLMEVSTGASGAPNHQTSPQGFTPFLSSISPSLSSPYSSIVSLFTRSY